MLEPQRSRYLRGLGIDIYVPRLILPGAKVSPPCAWESVQPIEAPTLAPVAAIAQQVADVQQLANVQQRPALAEQMRVAPAAKASVETTVAQIVAEVVPAPKIALSVVVSDCGILIIDDAPSTTAMRSEYLRLLANILFALQGRSAQPQLDIFLWPMVKHPQLDQGPSAARETLAAHIQKQLHQHQLHTVLLLGAAAQQWCDIDNETLRCVKSVSALSCLRTPASKRQLWSDIRSLAVVR